MSTRPVPRLAWLITPLLAVATFLGLFGISPMLEEGSWRVTVAICLGVVLAATMITRRLTRSRFLPTGIGMVLSVWVLVVAFARTDTGAHHWLPTPRALTTVGQMMTEAAHEAQVTVMPAPVTPDLLALVTAGCLALFVLAEHLASSWRSTALAGLALLGPWMPAIALQYRLELGALMGALGCWFVALGISTVWKATDRSPGLASVGIATAAVLALGALATPLVIASPGWGAFPRPTAPQSSEVNTRLNLALDLQASLTTNSDSAVLSYTTSGAHPDVWRLATLTEFNGNSWERQAPSQEQLLPLPHGAAWPEPVAESTLYGPQSAVLDVTILNLSDINLPVPAAPRLLELPGTWSYAPTMDEVVGESSIEGMEYRIYAGLGHIDAGALSAMTALPAVDEERGIGPEYTDLPERIDVDRITELAQEITADSTSRYDQALAIQTYLRDPLTFTYDTTVQPRGGDAIATFLDQRRGYCVQFASTMVMMMRALDVPARLGVGFLAGQPRGEGRFEVTGAQAHTWPEIFFPTVGWVRFEPTPATQTGGAPSHADPQSNDIAVPESVHEAAAAQERGEPRPAFTPRPAATPHASARPETPGAPEAPAPPPSQTPPFIVIGWIALALFLTVGVTWWIRLWRRSDDLDPEAAWERLRSQLDARWRWPANLTPLEVPDWLAQQWDHAGIVVEADVHRQVTFLATLVSDSRYAAHSETLSAEGLAELVAHVAGDVKASQRTPRGSQR